MTVQGMHNISHLYSCFLIIFNLPLRAEYGIDRIDEAESKPIALNTNLGYYTNFVNLLDLAAIALHAGFRDDGLPVGITLSDLYYGIEVEVWEIEIAAFGMFVVEVPAPLGIGTTVLESGEMVKGFICENWAIANA
jgi:hypothetical protein